MCVYVLRTLLDWKSSEIRFWLSEVTDVYFLAGYYGLMEVLVDEIKRLTSGCNLHA